MGEHVVRNPVTKAWYALAVIRSDKVISKWLGRKDPEALKQIEEAYESIRPLFEVDRECNHCGHKDTVKYVEDIPGMYGSAYSFCTACDRPWDSEAVNCPDHCGTEDE